MRMRISYRRASALEDVMENLLWACADPIGGRALLKMSRKIFFGHAQIAVTTQMSQRTRNQSIRYAHSWGLFSAWRCSDVQFFSSSCNVHAN